MSSQAYDTAGAGDEREPEQRSRGPFTGLHPFESSAFRYLFAGTALTMAGHFMQRVPKAG
jgi:hypothetical protein